MIDLPSADREPSLEVVEPTIDAAILAVIVSFAPTVRHELDAVPGRRRDCGYACSAWQRELESRGIEVRREGGVGEDEDGYSAGYRLIPLDQRSGYREGDGRVRRHWWLRVGPGRWLFDPTGHQFDDRGGLDLARYVVNGGMLTL